MVEASFSCLFSGLQADCVVDVEHVSGLLGVAGGGMRRRGLAGSKDEDLSSDVIGRFLEIFSLTHGELVMEIPSFVRIDRFGEF